MSEQPAKAGRAAKTEQEIQDWLAARVAEELEVDPAKLDVRKPFTELGMSSRTAVGIVGDLERWMKRRLSPTLLWDYPDIQSLARHLAAPESPPKQ
jgi:acyl carrier protein